MSSTPNIEQAQFVRELNRNSERILRGLAEWSENFVYDQSTGV